MTEDEEGYLKVKVCCRICPLYFTTLDGEGIVHGCEYGEGQGWHEDEAKKGWRETCPVAGNLTLGEAIEIFKERRREESEK